MSPTKRTFAPVVAIALVLALFATLQPVAAVAGPQRIVVRAGESIQSALDDAPPYSTIVVRPGIYEEALHIDRDGITLRGRPGTIIRTPEDAETPCRELGLPLSICVSAEVTIEAETGLLIGSGSIRDVQVSGFTIEDAPGSAIGVLSGSNIVIAGNTVRGAGCDGVFAADVSGFKLLRNRVERSNHLFSFCTGIIAVRGSEDGVIRRNAVTDVPGVAIVLGNGNNSGNTIKQNRLSGNCGGVFVSGDASQGGTVSTNNRVIGNTIVGNDLTCRPFEDLGFPEFVAGGFGVNISGAQNTVVKRNLIENNVVGTPTANPGGIRIEDAVGTPAGAVVLFGNRVSDNGIADSTVDILVAAEDANVRSRNNSCATSLPDASICGSD